MTNDSASLETDPILCLFLLADDLAVDDQVVVFVSGCGPRAGSAKLEDWYPIEAGDSAWCRSKRWR